MKILKFNEGSHIKIGTEKSELKTYFLSGHLLYAHDLERFVRNVYGMRDYYFHEAEEQRFMILNNISGQLSEVDTKKAKMIRDGNKDVFFSTATLLNCLCEDGYIEPGKYIIVVPD